MPILQTPENRMMPISSQKRWMVVIILLVLALVAGAASLAFLFESPSIKYKFGWEKTMLRSGKVIGLTAAVLLLLQLPLAGRIKSLDRIFSLPGLYRIHRLNGYLIAALIVLHPVLVFLPEGRLMIPFEARYWPEWVGAGLLLAVLSQVVISRWRRPRRDHYPKWLGIHRINGWIIIILLVVHVLYVSETFEYEGLPRTSVMAAGIVMCMVWIAVRLQRPRAKRTPFVVSGIEPAGAHAYTLQLEPAGNTRFQYFPGQFAFFSFVSEHISAEWHPFTLSSSPTRPKQLEVTIRDSGDWTRNVGAIRTGDRLYVHGPFGQFSHLFDASRREIVMIAGGIGITPMLSMLRQMADHGDRRRITLIWSNQSARHIFNRSELDALRQKLTHFQWIPIFTRTREPMGEFGRLTRGKLELLLADCAKEANIFLCGPPNMIHQVRKDLIAIGFSSQSINEELFGL